MGIWYWKGSKLGNRQYFSKYASSMPQNPSKSSMNGYKAFAFPTKITNCPQFVTSGQIGDKISQIRKKVGPMGCQNYEIAIICHNMLPQWLTIDQSEVWMDINLLDMEPISPIVTNLSPVAK